MLEGEGGDETRRNLKKQGTHTKFYTMWQNGGTRYACKTVEHMTALRREVLVKSGLCERTVQLGTSAKWCLEATYF